MLGSDLDNVISKFLQNSEISKSGIKDQTVEYVGSETVGEIIEKLLILNIRIWLLEDQAAEYKTLGNFTEYSKTKQILDVCFKNRRPKLVSALNKVFENLLVDATSFTASENIKLYKNEKNV